MFKIYADRLQGGQVEKINFQADSDFLDIKETDLTFPKPISIRGETYLADDHLVLHLKAETEVKVPCSICNEAFIIPISLHDFYHTVPLEELKSAIFDFRELLREDLLLQIPQFAECSGGKCPERSSLSKYSAKKEKQDEQFPFSQL